MQAAWQTWLFYGILTGCGWGFLNLNVFSVAVLKALPERYAGTAIGIANDVHGTEAVSCRSSDRLIAEVAI